MTKKEFFGFQKWVNKVLEDEQQEALSDGATLSEINKALPKLKHRILAEKGIDVKEYSKFEAELSSGKDIVDIPIERNPQEVKFEKEEKQGIIDSVKNLWKRQTQLEQTKRKEPEIVKNSEDNSLEIQVAVNMYNLLKTYQWVRSIAKEIDLRDLQQEQRDDEANLKSCNSQLSEAERYKQAQGSSYSEYNMLGEEGSQVSVRDFLESLNKTKKNISDDAPNLAKRIEKIKKEIKEIDSEEYDIPKGAKMES